jgi:uncharacterized protein YlxW (UPF0749 family)
MTTPLDPSLTALMVGTLASLLTLVVSKRLDASHTDRRRAADDRRADERDRVHELERCEEAKEMLRDQVSALRADNAGLRATLAAKGIPLPPASLLLIHPGDSA